MAPRPTLSSHGVTRRRPPPRFTPMPPPLPLHTCSPSPANGVAWSGDAQRRSVLFARHTGNPRETLILPPRQAWEQTFAGASGYPDRLFLDWADEELVVYGREAHSDPPWLDLASAAPFSRGAPRLGTRPRRAIRMARTRRRLAGTHPPSRPRSAQPPVTRHSRVRRGMASLIISDAGYAELLSGDISNDNAHPKALPEVARQPSRSASGRGACRAGRCP